MHPVESGRYVIPTIALEEFVNVICSWIRTNILGGLVPGKQRVGKSVAIKYFAENHKQWLGRSVGVVSLEVRYHRQTSEPMFFSDLLESLGFPSDKRRLPDVRNLLIGRLVQASASAESKKIVIFLDESQLLDDHMFKLLIGVHNQLVSQYEISVLWVLVGQPELEGYVATYVAQGAGQVIGRFMTDTYVFQPLSEINDFQKALECYDRELRHPKDGASYTEHFAPEAVARGWSLAAQSTLIWNEVDLARTEAGLPTSNGMTMQGFTTLMNYILRRYLPAMTPSTGLTSMMVRESILMTNCLIFEQQEALLTINRNHGPK